MCVTNFVKRAPRPVTVNVSANPSMISQRLASTFMPMMTSSSSSAKPVTVVNHQQHRPSNNNNVPCTYSMPAVVNGEEPKTKPKRRRKPQKPGLTAKKNERHFVKHDYHDHAFETDESDVDEETAARGKPRKPCSTAKTFPMKLHSLLERVEADGYSHIISWQPHGRCFLIHNPKEFADVVLPAYFRQTAKLTSFQRQLNLYGFARLTRGKDAGAYYHELFLRGKSSLVKRMKRTKIKGTKFKAASSPDQEPNFYAMAPVMSVSQVSDESSADNDSHKVDQNLNVPIPSNGCMPPMGYATSNSFDPIPLQVPCPQVFHPPMQTFPMFSVATNGNVATGSPTLSAVTAAPTPISSNNWGDTREVAMMAPSGIANGGFNAAPMTNTAPAMLQPASAADSILDDAVDELFNDAGPLPENIADLNDLWDPASFGEANNVGVIQNDLQLGNLLESFLEQS